MKKILIYTFILLIGVALLGTGVGMVSAQIKDGGPGMSLIIEKLVKRFNLDPEEVEEIFAEAREERFQQMKELSQERETNLEARLDKMVEEGKITEQQKEEMLSKREEMEKKREEFKNLSPEERQEALKDMQGEMKTRREEGQFRPPFPGFRGMRGTNGFPGSIPGQEG